MPISIPTMPKPSEEALSMLAEHIGHALPRGYLDFVNSHDGARPEQNLARVAANEISVSRFIPANEAAPLSEQINGLPEGVVPFAEDDCGNYFYVEAATGAVKFWDHEVEGVDVEATPDVSSFVEMLEPFDVSQVKLSPGQVRRVWVSPSFKPEF